MSAYAKSSTAAAVDVFTPLTTAVVGNPRRQTHLSTCRLPIGGTHNEGASKPEFFFFNPTEGTLVF
jgi:hypothetical protein